MLIYSLVSEENNAILVARSFKTMKEAKKEFEKRKNEFITRFKPAQNSKRVGKDEWYELKADSDIFYACSKATSLGEFERFRLFISINDLAGE